MAYYFIVLTEEKYKLALPETVYTRLYTQQLDKQGSEQPFY